jgi:NAD-dependent dihydropyrimidine dehydrogenase PreA subunit
MVSIKIDKEKCDGCGECVDICPAEVYVLEDQVSVPVNMEECTECCSCVEVCPTEAIAHESC